MNSYVRRAKLSASERNFRSRIAQLASTRWFLRGTLSERSGTCGKPNCRCAQGAPHHSVHLVQFLRLLRLRCGIAGLPAFSLTGIGAKVRLR